MTLENTFSFHIEPMQLDHYRDDLPSLAGRFTNFWAGVQYPARLITRTRRFSFAPIRQRLRQQTAPLDDVRELVPLLTSGDQAGAKALLTARLSTIQRAVGTLRDAPQVQDALLTIVQSRAPPADRTMALDGCQRAIWRWRWLKNYRRSYEVMEQLQARLAIDHYFVCWPDGYANPDAIRNVLQSSFLLPEVTRAPLPSMFTGSYREEATYLAPLDPGQPFLRVLTAYDVRGEWDLTSLRDLLMQDMELAIAIDVQTFSRFKAQRVTTDAHTVLEGAIYGKNAVKDAKSERAYMDVQYAMQQLDQQNLHEIAYSLLIQGPTLKALEIQTQTLRDLLGARMRLDVLAGSQAEYLKFFTAQPAKAVQAPVIRRNGLSEHLAVKTPWGMRKSRRLDGTLWGLDPFEGMPIHHDLFGVAGTENAHLLMLGKSGSGKTVALGALALRQAVAGHQVVMFDPVGHVRRLCEAVGGGATYYPIQTTATVNILDPLSTDLVRQYGHVVRKISMILGQVIDHGGGIQVHPRVFTNRERGALDEALQSDRIYGPDGSHLPQMDDQTCPLLDQLIAALRAGSPEGHDLAREIELIALRSKAHLFGVRTTLRWDFGSDVTGYDLQGADKTLLPLYLDHGFAALNRYLRSPERLARRLKTICIVDEFGIMAQIEALKAEVAYATKEWRNYGAALWSCDQNAATYMGGSGDAADFANLTTNNTAIKLIGRQEGTDARLLFEAMGGLLTPSHIATLRTAQAGEFIGIFGNEVHHLRVQLTDQEYPYFIRKG
jgi:hypothetical protein